MDQQQSRTLDDGTNEPFLELSRATGSSRILAVTDRLGLFAAIFIACLGLSGITTALALFTHAMTDQPIGLTGFLNTTLLPFLIGAPVLYVLLTLCRRLEVTRAELARLSSIDMLTGALNRRSILAWAEAACAQIRADEGRSAPLSLALIDADSFKAINDAHGHLTGDAVLQKLTAVTLRTLPSDCLFGRFGGEEFAVVMPGRDAETARALAESVRLAVEHGCAEVQGKPVKLSISLGVATASGHMPQLERLLSQADEALYAAKRAGRNRVHSWQDQQRASSAVNVIRMQPLQE